MIILKAGAPYLDKANLKRLFTLSIRPLIQNIGSKTFIKSFVNKAPDESAGLSAPLCVQDLWL
jgi:hypothetical protein